MVLHKEVTHFYHEHYQNYKVFTVHAPPEGILITLMEGTA